MMQMRFATLALVVLSNLSFACTAASNGASGDDDGDPQSSSGSSSGDANGSTSSSGGASQAPPLSATTFVFTRDVGDDQHLVAMDYASGDEHVITTLADESVDGWNIDGAAVSPDRTRIVIASHYGASAADLLVTANIVWTFDVDGADFVRLTPPVQSSHAGDPAWRIDVRDPLYAPDGARVAYDRGEGNGNGGYVAPFAIATTGGALPEAIELPRSEHCSTNLAAAYHPLSGDLLMQHSVCQDDSDEGYFLYPKAGGNAAYLVDEAGVSYDGKPSFSHDGSAFVYMARFDSTQIQSLLLYSMTDKKVVELVAGAAGRDIVAASFAPDDRHVVYCVRENGATNLRVLDFSRSPAKDKALTTDGKSCNPVF